MRLRISTVLTCRLVSNHKPRHPPPPPHLRLCKPELMMSYSEQELDQLPAAFLSQVSVKVIGLSQGHGLGILHISNR